MSTVLVRNARAKGFTLIELIVVIVIVGILSAIALPAYTNYVVRGKRVDVQARLMQIATNLERYKSQQLSYAGATMAIVNGGATTYPSSGAADYNLTLTLTPPAPASPTGWTLLATPVTGGRQVGDGALKIDSQGRRCWNPASDTDCDLANALQAWSASSK